MLTLLLLAGDAPISADRPGFLNSPTLVPIGRWQVETGAALEHERGASDAAATPIALRYGLQEDLELRASTAGWTHIDAHGAPDASGWGDLTLGIKRPIDRHWADLDLSSADAASWTAEVRLPTGAGELGNHGLAASISGVLSFSPDGPWQLETSLGLAWDPQIDSLVASFAGSASLPAWENGNVYTELGWFPALRTHEDPLFAGCGLTQLASNDVQLDLYVDAGLGESSGDWLAGFGISWRW